MAQEFDPYYTWLGIPPSERPANHYRLLGVHRFEENADVISNAADARMAFVRTFQAGPKGVHSQRILNELAAARITLLNEQRKAAYDQQLRAADAAEAAGSAVIPVAANVQAANPVLLPQAQYAAVAVADPLPALVPSPVIAVRKPARKRKTISQPLLIAGIAIPVILLGLVVSYLVTRGGNTNPTVEKPPVVPEIPPTPTLDPKPAKTPVTNPPSRTTENEKSIGENKPAVVPAVSKPGKIDLLALVETPRDVPLGEVVRENDVLSIRRRGGFTCAVVPYDLPPNYELELRVTPRDGEGLLIGVPIAGRRCMLTIDGFLNEPPTNDTRTALETIDGRRPQDPAYSGKPYFGKLLKPNEESRLTIRVRGASLTLTCDGKQVIQWSGDPARLGIFGLFNQGAPRRMFVGSWAAQYDVSGLTLQPLKGPTIVASTNGSTRPKPPTPAPPTVISTPDNRPWRWARFHDGAPGLVLNAGRSRAITFHPGRAPWSMQAIEISTGEVNHRLDGEGSIEHAQTLAAGPDSSPLLAFSVIEKNSITTLVKSLSSERKRERQFPKQLPDRRYAFSVEGKLLAASVGPRVNILHADTGRSIAYIDPPADMRLWFVDRLLDDNGLLLVLYSFKKAAGVADYRAVAYDWKTRRGKQSRDFITQEADLRGLHFQDDDLWVWGSESQRSMVVTYSAAGTRENHLRPSPGQIVLDIHVPSQTALIVDGNTPRLICRNWAANNQQTLVEYSAAIADARFVEDGKAIFCQPGTSADLTLLWETAPLLESRRVVAPTIQELGLRDVKLQTAPKAVQRSDVKLTRAAPVSPGSSETPGREVAKAELAKLRMPLPGGEVKFLNIQSSEFSEEHARLLLAFPELDGLHLQNIQPTVKMLEHFAQLPGLKHLTIVNSPVDDEHLEGLAQAPQLQSLQLHNTQILGDGLKHLVKLPLRSFGMAPKPPNLAGWQAIGQFKSLESCGNLGAEQSDEKLAAISGLPNLKYLNLSDVRLSGGGLKPIQKMTSIVHLDLPQIGVADDDLRPLQGLTNLQILTLPNSVGDGAIEFLPAARLTRLRVGAGISDAGLLAIARKYPDLHTCDLMQCNKATEKGLGYLADHARLQTLILPVVASAAMCEQVARMSTLKKLEQPFQALTAEHLAPLRRNPTLEEFQLTKVDDDALAELAQVPALKVLHLNDPQCKAKGLEKLAQASKLERISLMNGGVLREYGAAEGAALEKLTQLKQLNIFGTSLDQTSIDRIRQALPRAQVQILR